MLGNTGSRVALMAVALCVFAADAANIIKGVFVNAETGEYLVSPVYVSKTGNDANSGADWEHAKLTIQAGINAASSGGVVLVGPGDYRDVGSTTDGRTVVYLNKRIYLRSAEGKGNTFITGSWGENANGTGAGATRGIRITVAGAVVDGFTIRNCAVSPTSGGNNMTSCGAAVCGNGDQNMSNGVSTGATVNPSYVVNCTVENCRAYHGAAIRGAVSINTLFKGNVSVNDGHVGYRLYSAYNCIFIGNGNGAGRLVETSAGHMSVNCTFLLNACDTFVGASSEEVGRAVNCAFLANTGESSPNKNFYATNCFGDGSFLLKTTGTGCQAGRSLFQFFSPAAWDFTPVAGSDALDGGSDTALAGVSWIPDDFRAVDFNGNPRSVGEAVDVGAVEAPAGGVAIAYAPIGIGAGVALAVDGVVCATPEVVGAWYAITNSTPKMVRVTSTLPADRELFGYKLSSFLSANSWNGYRYPDKLGDGGAWLMPWKISEGGFIVSAKAAAGVKTVGAGEAYETIQEAVSDGADYDVIKVKPGTYAGSVNLYGHRAIRATGTPEETVITGGTAARCVYVDTGYKTLNVHLQGFTLTGADVGTWSGGGFCAALNSLSSVSNHVGLALGDSYNAQVTDCVISNNHAKSGSAVYGGWAQRCLIANNSSSSGRQIAIENAILSACVLIDNTASSNGSVHEQVFGATAYNCELVDTNPVYDSNRKQFDMMGLFNCCIVGGLLPWPSVTYEKALGCVAIGSFQYEGTPGLSGVEIFRDPDSDNLADKAGGDYRIRAGSYALRFGSVAPTNFTRFAVGDFNSKPLFFYNDATPLPGAYQVPAPVFSVASTVSTDMDPVAAVSPAPGRVEAGDTVTITRASQSRPEFAYVVRGVTNTTTELTYAYTVPDEPSAAVTEITPVALPCDLYVDPSKSDGNSGWTAETAKKTLANVMKIAVGGDVVHAAEGVYAEGEMTNTISFAGTASQQVGARVCVPAGVTLLASGSRDDTVIEGRYHSDSARQGANALRGVFLYPGATLEGFTVRKGATAARGGGCYDDNVGGCVATTKANDSRGTGTIRNCALRNGGARNAAGVWGGRVSRCLIIGCECSSDACASMYSTIENSIIANASRTTVNSHCGIRSSTIVSTSTCSDNELGAVAGAPVENSIVFVPGQANQGQRTLANWRNCIVQTTDKNSKILFDEATCTNILRMELADVKISLNDAYRLPADSPAVDAGDSALLAHLLDGTASDYAGGQRVYNRAVDIGAWEHDWRDAYAQTLATSRKCAVAAADPDVAKTGDAVEVFDGAIDVTFRAAGTPLNLGIDVLGNGTLTLFMGEDAVATFTKESAKAFRLNGTAQSGPTRLRFAYARADGDARGALLSGFALNTGMTFVIR